MAPLIVLLAVPLGLVPLILAIGATYGPVSRRRLAAFARRETLHVTVANAPVVQRYLACTRRWRTWGLFAGLVLAVLWSAWHAHAVQVGTTWLLAGWFAGALVAEWRVAQPAREARRRASLTPRLASDYVPPLWLWAPYAGLALGMGVLGWAVALRVPAGTVRDCALALLLVAVVVAAGQVVRRQVLRRARPVLPADVLAADDAVRSRSLHVLTGSALTLALYGVLAELAALGSAVGQGTATAGVVEVGLLAGSLLAPLLGYLIAVSAPVRRAAPARVEARR